MFTLLSALMAGRTELDVEALIDAHAGAVKRCAYLCLRDERLAEDICQEVFLKLWQAPPRTADDAGMRAWLLRVTLNACRDLLRTPWRRRTQPTPGEAFDRRDAQGPMPEAEALRRERDESLYQAVMGLPVKYREPIILHYYFDCSQRDTARILAIGDSTLRTRLLRARLLLRQALGEDVEL